MESAVTLECTTVVQALDQWLDAMRVDWPVPGYGGRVVHWWNHCLAYRGAGLDWRYEGLISGYLTLWRRTNDEAWLRKALRCGDDLFGGQRSDGHFVNSRFELNPGVGGTPHEVACDLGLLELSAAIADTRPDESDRYLQSATRNLESYAFSRLWDESSRTFRDSVTGDTFVPNKAATFVEAVILLARRTNQPGLIERFALPTAERIVRMQVDSPGDVLDGAIAQNQMGKTVIDKYFPIYIARCIPALIEISRTAGEPRFGAAATRAARFLERIREPDGSFPMVLYPRGRMNRNPRWVAGAGDVVRALDAVRAQGDDTDSAPTIRWILGGARPDGRIVTAAGFGEILPFISRRERQIGEMGVVGWCDKALRALAHHVEPGLLASPAAPVAAIDRARFASETVIR